MWRFLSGERIHGMRGGAKRAGSTKYYLAERVFGAKSRDGTRRATQGKSRSSGYGIRWTPPESTRRTLPPFAKGATTTPNTRKTGVCWGP